MILFWNRLSHSHCAHPSFPSPMFWFWGAFRPPKMLSVNFACMIVLLAVSVLCKLSFTSYVTFTVGIKVWHCNWQSTDALWIPALSLLLHGVACCIVEHAASSPETLLKSSIFSILVEKVECLWKGLPLETVWSGIRHLTHSVGGKGYWVALIQQGLRKLQED